MSRVGSFEIKEGDISVEYREIDNFSLGTRASAPPPPPIQKDTCSRNPGNVVIQIQTERVGVTWGNLGETESGSTSCKREVIGPMAPGREEVVLVIWPPGEHPALQMVGMQIRRKWWL